MPSKGKATSTMDIKDPQLKRSMDHLLLTYAPKIEQHVNHLKRAGLIPSHIDSSDLHEPGIYGLMEAVGKFKESKPYLAAKTDEDRVKAFHSYADQRIRGRILDHVAEQDPTRRFKAKFSGIKGSEPREE